MLNCEFRRVAASCDSQPASRRMRLTVGVQVSTGVLLIRFCPLPSEIMFTCFVPRNLLHFEPERRCRQAIAVDEIDWRKRKRMPGVADLARLEDVGIGNDEPTRLGHCCQGRAKRAVGTGNLEVADRGVILGRQTFPRVCEREDH